MRTTTTFNPADRYIGIPVFVSTVTGRRHRFTAILDTGAPRTEFSDAALQHAGFEIIRKKDVEIKDGLQTQKHADVNLPTIEICSQRMENLRVYVSRFDQSWGIDALIGLDFFRHFEVKINYKLGAIVTKALSGNN